MSEKIGSINFYGDDIEANTDNLSLYTHREEPHLDHVFLRMPERYNENEQGRAIYLWKTIGKTAAAFALFAPELENHPDAEVHRNIRFAATADREEYEKAALKEMNSIDWERGPWA